MRSDASLAFVPIGTPLSLVAADGVDIASSQIIDLIGSGSGTAPANIIGTRTLFGADMGIGSDRPMIDVVLGTGLVTGNSATLNIALQGAPDTGSGGGYLPGTWQTFAESGEITAAQGTANTRVARLDIEAAFPENVLPRYLRLLFQVPASTHFTAGTCSFAIVTSSRDDQSNMYAAKNFKVA